MAEPTAGRRRGATILVQSRPQIWGHLVASSGPHANAELALWGDEIQIGARPGNDVVLQDEAVSGQHALLNRTDREVELTDRGSTNGTFVNGERVDTTKILTGDLIRMGHFEYLFRAVEG